jgi:hypothetical protein
VREPLWWLRAGAGLFPILRQRKAVPAPVYRSWMMRLRQPERIS